MVEGAVSALVVDGKERTQSATQRLTWETGAPTSITLHGFAARTTSLQLGTFGVHA